MLSIIESMLQLYITAICAVVYTISTTGTGDEERECRGCLEPGAKAGTLPGTVRHWTLDQLFAATTYTVYTGDVYV